MIGATTKRGQTLQSAYLNALQKKLLAKAKPVTFAAQKIAARREANKPLPLTTAQTQPATKSMGLSLTGILGTVGEAVGSIFGTGTGTSTGPTTSSVIGAVGTGVANVLSVLPGGVPGAMAVTAMSLPGRASTGGGTSEYLLEKPSGGGAVSSGLARLGIPPGWTRKKIKALVRYVGPGQAAAIVGAPLESVAIIAVSTSSRGRGISARDLRVTKRVTRKVLGIARDLAAIRPPASRRAPSRGTRVICN